MPTEKTEASHDGKKLLDATRPFAEESRTKSWWYLGSTLVILGAVLVLAAVLPWWPLRLAASIAGGLVFVRAFMIELQHPVVTSLRPRDILSCFRANLWEIRIQRMVSYREARASTEEQSC